MKKYKIILYQLFVRYTFFINQSKLRKKRIWWRDDDSYDVNKHFEKLLLFREKMNIYVYLSVIPSKITDSFIDTVNKIKPVYVLPHGYEHRNHSTSDSYLNEYPENRGSDKISKELTESIQKLKKCFPNKYLPIFVPPWEHYSDKILPLLSNHKIGVLSLSGKKKAGRNFKCINCNINFHTYKNYKEGKYKVIHKNLISLCFEIVALCKDEQNNELIGFMTHHKDMDDEDWDNYGFLLKLLFNYGCLPSNHEYFIGLINGKK